MKEKIMRWNYKKAFITIVVLAVQTPRDGGDKAVLGKDRLFAGVHQQECAGTGGVLGFAGTACWFDPLYGGHFAENPRDYFMADDARMALTHQWDATDD